MDNKKEIENIKKEILEKIFGEGKSITKIETIGGMTNKNYLIVIENEKLVFRNPGKGSDKLINRKKEHSNIKKIIPLNIDAELIYFNEDSGIKITKFIENTETMSPKSVKNNLKEISKVLKKLHTSNILFENKFEIFKEIKQYESKVQMEIENLYPNYSLTREKILKLEEKLVKLGINYVSCHNDTVPENFIKSKEKIFLIDWEYSDLNEAEWDIAALSLESSLSKKEEKEFLKYYYHDSISSKNLEKILIYKILQDFLWSLWTIVKFENGIDFGNYGIERYKRCLKLVKELEENVR